MKKTSMIFALVGLLVGCGLWQDEGVEKPTASTSKGEKSPEILQGFDFQAELEILKDAVVADKLFVAFVKAGDVLTIELSGTKSTPQFSRIYEKDFSKLYLIPAPPINDGRYRDRWEKDWCTLLYRDFDGIGEEKIEFAENFQGEHLWARIGGKRYPLGKIVDYSGEVVRLELKITREMVRNDNGLYLVVEHPRLETIVKTGFLGFGDCRGRKRFKFSEEDLNFEIHDGRDSREYRVNIFMKSGDERR